VFFMLAGEADCGFHHPTSSSVDTGAFSWGVKRPGLEADHLVSIAEL
jgi:hydrogenase/urease accessory protein HupE